MRMALSVLLWLTLILTTGCGGCGGGERDKNKLKDIPKPSSVE